MASFYEVMTDTVAKERVETFIKNYVTAFGEQPDPGIIASIIEGVIEQKKKRFVEDAFSDFPVDAIKKMKTIVLGKTPTPAPILSRFAYSGDQTDPEYEKSLVKEIVDGYELTEKGHFKPKGRGKAKKTTQP